MENLRQTAIPSRIIDITKGRFIRKEGLEPSYILTDMGQKISRTKIVGTIVDKFIREESNYSTITLDDDTDSIQIKTFGNDTSLLENFDIGDIVFVIGKIREYNNQNYIIPEIIKKVEPDYEYLHKLEVLRNLLEQKKIIKIIKKHKDNFADLEELKRFLKKKYNIDENIIETIFLLLNEKQEAKEKDYKPLIIKKIEELDKGDGVEIKILFEQCKLPGDIFEEVVNELLSEGICYEPKPGVLKVV
ncbi:MAG: hypothetical protein J7J93_03525 [Candidatus Aenigmarchaeota archaeon]|nr:hypothetical protein [Candidatus Aenigmarchaeota archaeon]